MEAELVAAALAMKETVFCSNMMAELGFRGDFEQVPLHVDNIATLHIHHRKPHVQLSYQSYSSACFLHS